MSFHFQRRLADDERILSRPNRSVGAALDHVNISPISSIFYFIDKKETAAVEINTKSHRGDL